MTLDLTSSFRELMLSIESPKICDKGWSSCPKHKKAVHTNVRGSSSRKPLG